MAVQTMPEQSVSLDQNPVDEHPPNEAVSTAVVHSSHNNSHNTTSVINHHASDIRNYESAVHIENHGHHVWLGPVDSSRSRGM